MTKSATRAKPPSRGLAEVVNFSDAMPAAPEAERTLLAAVFSDGTSGATDAPSLRAAIAEGIRSRHFADDIHRQIFVAMRTLLGASAPVEIMAVWQAIEAEHGEVSAQVRERIVELSQSFVSFLHVAGCVNELQRAEAARQQMRAAVDLLEAVKSGDEEQQREARRRIADAGHEDRGGLPRIVNGAALFAKDCPSPAVLVAGLLHRGGKMLLGGGSKSFKSWVLIDLALSIAAGVPFWDIATTQGRVLYLNFEIGEPFFRKRLLAVATAKGLEPERALQFLDVWTLRGHAADLTALMPHIIAQAAGRDYVMIILDPVYKCLGDRDENSAGEIASLLNEVDKLAVRTNAAVCISHHFAKGSASGKDSKDRVSGSGVWSRDPDALVTLTQHEAEGVFSVEFTVRNFAPKDPFCVRWDAPLMRRANDLDPAALKPPGRPRQFTADSLLSLLPETGSSYGEWLKIAKADGMSDGTFKTLRRELVDKGAVNHVLGKYLKPTASQKGGAQ
jgi:hypothetical protein